MKTKFLFSLCFLWVAFNVSAQEYQPQIGFSTETGAKTNFKKNKAVDNWFISLAGGGSILIGDDNGQASFADRLNINPQLSFGKWFNPYFAFRVQLTGGPIVGYDADRTAPTLFKQENTFFASHADFLLDVTNLWAPYREKKVFRLIPWVGLGYAQRLKNQDISRTESPTLNGGILTAFRLSKRVDLNVEIQGSLLNEDFNRIYKYHLTDFIAQGTVGLTFKLGKTDFEVIEPMDYALLNDLNSQINALRSENEALSRRPVSCPDCPSVVPTTIVNNYAENVVYFRLNSARIDANQQINIYNTAEFMKENKAPIKVIGYADKKTGTSTYNLTLSEKRARAVAKELIEKYGISSDQISIEWKGSDVQPFNENNWNRVVIMTTGK
ncbi:MAG: OmpA family protein [Tannerellaceae bacterium]|jgi:outer membrane protein OmpA-like peptidoglycan-associated protein|nr:OmpA family protein [Tannerellaceae bacterium]